MIKEIASKLKALLKDIKRLADRKKKCETRSDIEIVALHSYPYRMYSI